MPRKWVPILICQNIIWKETAMWMKHIRKYSPNLEDYNNRIIPLIELFRKTEQEIIQWVIIDKFVYREKINSLNIKDFQKGEK